MSEFTAIPEERDDFPGYDPEKPSRAVVAMPEGGGGCVLWWVGNDLYFEDEAGMRTPDQLGLENDAPVGISIWEGRYRTVRCGNPLDGEDYDTEAVGSFREPTDDEWELIRAGLPPWDEAEWWARNPGGDVTPAARGRAVTS